MADDALAVLVLSLAVAVAARLAVGLNHWSVATGSGQRVALFRDKLPVKSPLLSAITNSVSFALWPSLAIDMAFAIHTTLTLHFSLFASFSLIATVVRLPVECLDGSVGTRGADHGWHCAGPTATVVRVPVAAFSIALPNTLVVAAVVIVLSLPGDAGLRSSHFVSAAKVLERVVRRLPILLGHGSACLLRLPDGLTVQRMFTWD